MMQSSDPASLPLRDIHLPDAISWWPLAPGWWISLLLVIILITLIVYFVRRYRNHKLSALYLANKELEQIKNNFDANQNKIVLVKALSELIRRVSISVFQRQETAGLTGEEWLTFLDRYTENNAFNNGIGRVLIEAPYQANPDFNSNELLELISSWLDAVKKRHKRYKK